MGENPPKEENKLFKYNSSYKSTMPNTMSYETKQPTTTFEDYIDNEVFYNTAKEDVIQAIHNDKKIIMLIGSGSNGKSYLTNELNDFLNLNNYSVYQDRFSMCNDAESFNTELESTTGKILIHLHFDPFERWGIIEPPNSEIISMEHIQF